jgi:hypothetical protein
MDSSQDFLQAATIHDLIPRFLQNCNYLWPQAKISSKLQLIIASSKNFFKAATIHGLKPKFLPSCKCSWPQAKISSKLQLFMT